jgi:hypothetical protein
MRERTQNLMILMMGADFYSFRKRLHTWPVCLPQKGSIRWNDGKAVPELPTYREVIENI